MEKIEKYQKILTQFLEKFAKKKPANLPNIEVQVIKDLEKNHFQLTYVGWQEDKYIFSPIFHFDIKDGKIWVQCNNTESEINRELKDLGVSSEDIVLGFQPPSARDYYQQQAAA